MIGIAPSSGPSSKTGRHSHHAFSTSINGRSAFGIFSLYRGVVAQPTYPPPRSGAMLSTGYVTPSQKVAIGIDHCFLEWTESHAQVGADLARVELWKATQMSLEIVPHSRGLE